MRRSESNPYSPAKAVSGNSESVVDPKPKQRSSKLQMLLTVACWIWIGGCGLWFSAAMYELIRFTWLQNAYGEHTPVFRASYAKSAVMALVLGVPAVIVLCRIRHLLRHGASRLKSTGSIASNGEH